ncbi:MAG: M20 family metallopeptidase [Candidatus Omnitrophica bacterium]|nr:M20 family metallopeptidase [Candidatus Omnitrophota bacterium]MDD5351672.1 M20 family metallopeptidase [Candidatus Omnitrophota bacterium]MDD5550882.1 M20 family metallopeptidase [Candidatus Omnitrophota bacterium]
MFSANRLVKLTQDLIKIDSQNPPGDERRIAVFIKRLLFKSGLNTRLLEFGKNRFNTITVLKGKKSEISLLITPHLDTVPFGKNWKYPPLAARIHKNRIYGRGATDCKGNLAVGLEVLRNLAEENIKLNYDIIFAATADEETGSQHGLLPLLERKIIKPTYALILDADEFDIILAQKGLMHIKIGILGRKAHGAYPERGINAIDIALEVINKIKKIKFPYRKHRLLKPPTINVGTIRGGDKVNMVADWCEFELDVRFLPGMDKHKIISSIKNKVRSVTKNFKFEITALQAPSQIRTDHILVYSLKQASTNAIGKYRLKGSQGATVMTFFDKYNIPCVATGFGSSQCAHATDEYVAVNNLILGYNMLRNFLFVFDKYVR